MAYILEPEPAKEEEKKTPHLYIPSYLHSGSVSPAKQQNKQYLQHQQLSENNEKSLIKNDELAPTKKVMTEENAIARKSKFIALKKNLPKKTTTDKKEHQSMLAASFDSLKQEQLKSLNQPKEIEEPILLGGRFKSSC